MRDAGPDAGQLGVMLGVFGAKLRANQSTESPGQGSCPPGQGSDFVRQPILGILGGARCGLRDRQDGVAVLGKIGGKTEKSVEKENHCYF